MEGPNRTPPKGPARWLCGGMAPISCPLTGATARAPTQNVHKPINENFTPKNVTPQNRIVFSYYVIWSRFEYQNSRWDKSVMYMRSFAWPTQSLPGVIMSSNCLHGVLNSKQACPFRLFGNVPAPKMVFILIIGPALKGLKHGLFLGFPQQKKPTCFVLFFVFPVCWFLALVYLTL